MFLLGQQTQSAGELEVKGVLQRAETGRAEELVIEGTCPFHALMCLPGCVVRSRVHFSLLQILSVCALFPGKGFNTYGLQHIWCKVGSIQVIGHTVSSTR